ncbi:phospho-acceptor domain-containing protein [Pseudoduganella lurida]|uniref:histidine kinase n=2 Tax=Pseudoduganella lurida TaxID=1036180 RepID=A0A562RAT6_9BURK|nr:phospho-acceptor domain-containing protein [Pseudoduganella lurida]
MLSLQDRVLATWAERVRASIPQVRDLQQPILIDTLPVFYRKIVESVDPCDSRALAVDGSTTASEHGGERARLTSYDQAALVEEYQILRWAILDVLFEENVTLDRPQTHAIHASIDAGIREAVGAFALVQTGFRERFAAALMHDLRTPLGVNIAALELILLANDVTTIKVAAAKALTNAERINAMIGELLDTMAFQAGQSVHLTITSVDIREVIKEVQTDAIATHGPRIRVTGDAVTGWWDRPALKRALENLISNAVKYGRPGGPITVHTRSAYERLLLSVHNEGSPIPPLEQESIFQMYCRSQSAQRGVKQGWGVGLPYVRAVAESHGGSINVDSSAERGTTFLIDIPKDGRQFQVK